MDPERFARIQALFDGAADLPEAEQRAYLEAECGGDAELIAAAQAMLDEDARRREREGDTLVRSIGRVAHAVLGRTDAYPVPGDLAGYRILRILGEGGMGVVYLAERTEIGGEVAIKVLRDGLFSPARRDRFVREQELLVQLNHPSIARIYDARTVSGGNPWFAMEYVDGVPITQYRAERQCGISELLRLFRSVCEAVQYAHSNAIIHRDLKPSNILVTNEGAVKLVDFGIAIHAEDGALSANRLTMTGLRPMTLAYASPEQIRGDNAAIRNDVYSLGVVLYELLTGRLPFDLSGLGPTEAGRVVREEKPKPPSNAGGGKFRLSRSDWNELDVLCLTAMHSDSARRYGSVEALLRDLDHYAKGEPLEARPDSLRYRAGKFVRRNRRALLAAAAVLAAAGALGGFFALRLNRERNATLAEAARTQRIEQFMLTLFDGGDKEAGPAGDLRVVSLLDRGVNNAKTLSADPQVQAELYGTLGGIYDKLGRFAQAGPLLESALERSKALNGADSTQAADRLVALGMLRFDEGKLPEAERLLRDGLAMERRHLPPDDTGVARAVFALGKVIEERGSYDEAIRILEPAVKAQSARGASTADLAFGMASLAGAHFYLGHLDEAGVWERKALAMDRQVLGNVHPRVADVLLDLGEIDHSQGKFPDMDRHYREALAIDQAWYGREHPNTAMALLSVGQGLYHQQRFDEAAPFVQEAVDIQSRLLDKMNPQVAMGLNILSVVQLRRKHLDEAEAANRRMLEIDLAQYGERHQLTAIAWMNLAEVYFLRNNPAEAERVLRKALGIFEQVLPAGHQYILTARVRLAHALVVEKRYKDAEALLLPEYEAMVKQPNAALNGVLVNTRRDLLAVYTQTGRAEQAARIQAELAGK